MHWTGYSKPTACGLWGPTHEDDLFQDYCGQAGTRKTEADHKRYDKEVMDKTMTPKECGSHGPSPVTDKLKYTQYNSTFGVSVAHMFLLGLVKDLWKLFMAKKPLNKPAPWFSITPAMRKLMVERGKHITATLDQSRPYLCVVDHKGNWVMEDWLNWIEFWSPYVLMLTDEGCVFPDPDLEEMWSRLRGAVLFYMRPFEEEEGETKQEVWKRFEAECETQRVSMWRYACLAQERFSHLLCKSNLHKVFCGLVYQQLQRGHAFFFTEFWIEQLVQWSKQLTKDRTTGCPEKLIFGGMLLSLGLHKVEAKAHNVKDMYSLVRTSMAKPELVWRNPDTADVDGTQFLGGGVSPVDWGFVVAEECMAALKDHFYYFSADAWPIEEIQDTGLVVYTYAHRKGSELLHSQRYERARSRESHYIRIRYTGVGTGEGMVYVGVVKYFLLAMPVRKGRQDPSRKLRFAVCDLYPSVQRQYPCGAILEAKGVCGPSAQPAHRAYPVLMSSVDCKMIRCQPPAPPTTFAAATAAEAAAAAAAAEAAAAAAATAAAAAAGSSSARGRGRAPGRGRGRGRGRGHEVVPTYTGPPDVWFVPYKHAPPSHV
jgi:hypothetical protein